MAANTTSQAVSAPGGSGLASGPGAMWVVLTGVFMATLDFFIVNVAIPAIHTDLGAGEAEIQWLVAGYALTYGAGLITGGRLGDLYGRRAMFALGLALFTVASIACGLAPSPAFLVEARLVQGLAAALMSPQVLAILRTAYTGPAQARVFGLYGLTMGVAAVFGQLIGGLLIKGDILGLGWRACFLINLPIGAAALARIGVVPESRAPVRARLDLVGTALATAALVAILLPLIQGREQGWPTWTWVCLGAAVPLLAVFGVHQARSEARERAPLVPPSLFRERAFTVGLLAQVVFWMGQASFFLVFALYLQQGRGLDALGSGLVFSAIGLGYLVTSITAHRIAARLGRQVLALGGVIMIVGVVATGLAVSASPDGAIAWLIPGLIVDGAGMGMAVAPLAATVLARVSPHHAGAASGVLSTGLQIGNSLGVAIIGLIFYGALNRGYAHAFDLSLGYLAGVGLALTLLVQLLPRKSGT